MKTWIAIIAVAAQIICLAGSGWARPFTRIVSPVQDQCVPGPDVTIKFEAGGMTLGPSAWNLHFKLDEEPFQVQYDGNHAHVFKNVRPGTHTVRVYAANAMHEAIPGTQSTVSFSVGYWDTANYVMPGQPTLTYNLPQGEYVGIDAADITVDFLLENVTLSPGGYQVAYYADGRRFLVQDGCGPRHLKDLAPGHHQIRIELQDQNGDVVPGPFNKTERIILVSPDQVRKSPSPIDDGYQGLPRLDSIKGSMTMGQHWSATEQVLPLTQAEIDRQQALTVRRADGGTVGLRDGLATSGGPAEVDKSVTVRQSSVVGEVEEQFTVRQGGELEGATDLDAVESPNIRRGTIAVDQPDEIGDEESGAVMDRDEEVPVDVRVLPSATPVPVSDDDDDDDDAAAVDADDDEPVARTTTARTTTTTPTTRRRADGSVTTVRQTTETRRLEDRPGLRQPDSITTRTVRTEQETSPTAGRAGGRTTGTRSGQTTGPRAMQGRGSNRAADVATPAATPGDDGDDDAESQAPKLD